MISVAPLLRMKPNFFADWYNTESENRVRDFLREAPR
jgi:hypothetical protein